MIEKVFKCVSLAIRLAAVVVINLVCFCAGTILILLGLMREDRQMVALIMLGTCTLLMAVVCDIVMIRAINRA